MKNVMMSMSSWWSRLWRKKYDGLEPVEFDKLFAGDIIVLEYNKTRFDVEILDSPTYDIDIVMGRYLDKSKHERTLLYRYTKAKYYKRTKSQLVLNLMNL